MKFAINFGANVTAFLLSVFLSVWMTPFIVKTLGVEAFGFVHLTQNIINYFSIITVALSSVVVRFFSVAAHRGNRDEANAYVSNYLAASVVISLLLAVPLAGTAFFIDKIMNVPAGLLTDVRLSIVIGSVLFMLTFFMAGFATGRFLQTSFISQVPFRPCKCWSGCCVCSLCLRACRRRSGRSSFRH